MTSTDFITINDAGEYLGVSIRTIQRYIKNGRIKSKHINGKTIISKSSMEGLKNDVDIVRSAQEKTETEKNDPTSLPSNQRFEMNLVKDSLDTLRDQLKSKDDQIKDLSMSVRELQTTQKLLIEKGLNLTVNALGMPSPDMSGQEVKTPTEEPDKNEIDTMSKVFNIAVNKENQNNFDIAIRNHQPGKQGNQTNKYFIISILAISVIIVFVGIIFYLIK